MKEKVLIIGGSGNLGTELVNINPNFQAPNSSELDISDINSLEDYLKSNNVDIIINCAAITDTASCETDIKRSLNVNTLGPANLVILQDKYNFKIVHISTDYVFDGEKGNYKVDDPINPISNYSKSKAAAELIVRMSKNSLVIRTSFFPKIFPHKKAFVDQYTTKDFVDIIAPMVYEASISGKIGVIHIGTEKDTVFNKVKKRSPEIEELSRKDIKSVFIPNDVSLS
jgi:dTDP-4-dehydrorhamnose reductase